MAERATPRRTHRRGRAGGAGTAGAAGAAASADALAAIRATTAAAPHLAQYACFDTAFHRTQPRLSQLFALPRAITDAGVLRYGFHGISYEYIARQLPLVVPAAAAGRVVVAHLGNGASLCALLDGRSVATTMSFTALDGLMMGTRCGAIDPGRCYT